MLTFQQSPWLKTYIDFNTRQRSLAGDSFLKNNGVFGKTQENLRNSAGVELITDARILGNPITDCLTVVQCSGDSYIESAHLRGRVVETAHV